MPAGKRPKSPIACTLSSHVASSSCAYCMSCDGSGRNTNLWLVGRAGAPHAMVTNSVAHKRSTASKQARSQHCLHLLCKQSPPPAPRRRQCGVEFWGPTFVRPNCANYDPDELVVDRFVICLWIGLALQRHMPVTKRQRLAAVAPCVCAEHVRGEQRRAACGQ